MIRVSVLVVGFVMALSSCALAPKEEAMAGDGSLESSGTKKDDTPALSANSDATSAPVRPPAIAVDPAGGIVSSVTASSLSIWKDPAFRKRFTESYVAETEIEPLVTLVERDLMQEVFEFMSSGDLDKARSLVNKKRGDEASAVLDFTLANIHFEQDRLEPAARIYEIAVEKCPKFRRAWKNLGLAHVRLADFNSALPALLKVIELGGGDGLTFGLVGYCYYNLENFLPAESAYRMASLLDPKTMDWQVGLARSLFKEERFADAASLCGSMIAGNPDSADLWLLQANAFLGLERPLRAAENFEMVDRMGRSTPESLNLLGDIYVSENLLELGAATYIRVIEKGSKNEVNRAIRSAKNLSARGGTESTRNVIQSIESRYESSLTGDQSKDLLRLKARIAVVEGAGEEEMRILEEIVELDPLDGDALILLGRYYGRNEESERAGLYFERAADLEGHEPEAKQRHGQMLVRLGRYTEALPLLKRSQVLRPRDTLDDYVRQVERLAQTRR